MPVFALGRARRGERPAPYGGGMPAELRPATLDDLDAIYAVCTATGADGLDASAAYGDPRLLGHIWAAPHLVADASLCTVVVDDAGVAGYLVATDDTTRFEQWCERSWWPALREQYPMDAALDPRDADLVRLLHAPEVSAASTVRDFPAHLHINLLPRLQGLGLGRSLIERLLEQLRSRTVPGVHLGVSATNSRAIAFYEHLGFRQIDSEPDGLIMGMRLLQG